VRTRNASMVQGAIGSHTKFRVCRRSRSGTEHLDCNHQVARVGRRENVGRVEGPTRTKVAEVPRYLRIQKEGRTHLSVSRPFPHSSERTGSRTEAIDPSAGEGE